MDLTFVFSGSLVFSTFILKDPETDDCKLIVGDISHVGGIVLMIPLQGGAAGWKSPEECALCGSRSHIPVLHPTGAALWRAAGFGRTLCG